MATFTIGDALGSGFRLIGRRPFSVLAWGLAYLVLAVLPTLAMFAWMAPDLAGMFQKIATQAALQGAGQPPDMGAIMPLQAKMMMFQPILMLAGILGRAVLAGAIFRAVLEPRNSSFAFLRIGMQEVWLGLLTVAFTILAAIFLVLVCGGGALLGFAIGAAMHAAQALTISIVLVEVALGLALFCLVIWVFTRFSLAFPMTFAEREFRLFEFWSVTKGHAWKLFGMGLLLTLIVMLIVMVFEGAVIGAVLLAAHGMMQVHTQMQALFYQPPDVWLKTLAPWIAGGVLVGAYLTAALSAIMLAPWATAYREITGGSAPPAPVFEEPLPVPPPAEDHAAPPPGDHGHDDHGSAAPADDHGHDDHGHDDHVVNGDGNGPDDPHAKDGH